MTDRSITREEVAEEYRFLGDRALTSDMINREVPATADAFGPENKLVFAPGYLSGTPLINTCRVSVGICQFAGTGMATPEGAERMFAMIAAKVGRPFGETDWEELG
jgi:aldehyde:ferredoxin oxidoreductase